MKNGYYESHAEQIEKSELKRLRDRLKELGVVLPRSAIAAIREAMRGAAFCGAAGERDRALAIVRSAQRYDIENSIGAKGIWEVMGYEVEI